MLAEKRKKKEKRKLEDAGNFLKVKKSWWLVVSVLKIKNICYFHRNWIFDGGLTVKIMSSMLCNNSITLFIRK